jgi:eukaryotic-like serine/threonine-protein kinase
VTGAPPFTGDSPVAVAYQHVREPAVPPSDHDTSLTPEIDAIVMKALAKRVEDRYQSAAAMRADIERYLAGHPVRATAPPLPFEPQTAVAPPYPNEPATQSTLATQPVPPEADDDRGGNRTGLFILLGALLVALIIGGAVLLPQLFEDPPEQVQVPDLIGMTESQARAAIGDAGLSVGQPEYVADPEVARDKVIRQEPNRDTFVDPGTTVTITVSTGKPMTSVPSVVGQDRSAARATLESAGLVPVFEERDSDEPRNQVVETRPAAGQEVPEGTRITVFFSDGPEEVPDVVGMTEQEATRTLEQAGFRAFVTRSPDTEQPKGTVIEQNPPGGTERPEGDSVTIVVSSFEEPTETPTPTPTPSIPTGTPSTEVPPTP